MAKVRVIICPYCGDTQKADERCRLCGGRFDSLSRRATHNEMGPWFVRSDDRPFQPPCAYETLVKLIEKGHVTKFSIVRGPTTRQFWTVAKRVPGLAHLLGYCHDCDGRVNPEDHNCSHCGAAFGAYLDRNWLGLPDVRPLPGDAPGAEDALSLSGIGAEVRGPTPRGLSSFGRDEDLLDDSAAPDASGGNVAIAAATAVVASRAQVTAPDATAGTLPDESLSSPLVRAMQRRIVRQERTNRIMGVLLVVAVLAGVIFNLNSLGRFAGNPDEAPPEETATGATDGAAAPDAVLATPETRVDEEDAESSPQAEPNTAAPASEPNGAVAPSAPEPDADAQDVIARARGLIREAAQATSETVKLERYQQARAALQALDSGAERDALLETVIEAIEKIELEEFFGGG